MARCKVEYLRINGIQFPEDHLHRKIISLLDMPFVGLSKIPFSGEIKWGRSPAERGNSGMQRQVDFFMMEEP